MPTDNPAKAGQTITIGVDADGNLTGPLPSTRNNTMAAVTDASGIWALGAGTVLLPHRTHTHPVQPKPTAALGTGVETTRHATEIAVRTCQLLPREGSE